MILFSILLASCGSDSNILGFLTPEAHRNSFTAELAAARVAYDSNDLADAYKHSKNAFQLNSSSEEAAVLYGFVNLSMAGSDPFQLFRRLGDSENSESDGIGILLQSGGTSDTLSTLQSVVGITKEDVLSIGNLDEEDVDLPILIPLCAEEARLKLKKLEYLDAAINAVCPFVDPDLNNSAVRRQKCEPTIGVRSSKDKAHFLWAFTHLTEALAFNAVFKFGGVSTTKSNLELRVEKLKSQDTATGASLESFIDNVKAVESTVNAVLPIGGVCSDKYPTTQLIATLNDLLAVSAAFDKMAGLPESFTKNLNDSIQKIKNIQGTEGQTKALKSDLSKKMAASLAEKIDSLGGGALTAEKAEELCSAYGSISGGSTDRPDLCQ